MAKSRFVDLRAGPPEHGVNDSFWPAFADIMTVVVMIFLMALMVVVLKNWQLVQTLQQSIEKERLALQTVEAEKAVSADLAGRLANLEEQVGELQLLLLQARQEGQELADSLTQRESQVRVLEADNLRLSEELNTASSARDVLYTEQQATLARVTDLETNLENIKSSLTAAESLSANLQQALTTSSEEYASLKVKYDKLVRPARTSQGKMVVEIHFSSSQDGKPIQMKLPGEPSFSRYSINEMHAALQPLQRQHPSELYMKIVFPEGSQITHKEAWDFTSSVLERYDYYYQ